MDPKEWQMPYAIQRQSVIASNFFMVHSSNNLQAELYHKIKEKQSSISDIPTGVSKKQLSDLSFILIKLAEEAHAFQHKELLKDISQSLLNLPYPPESKMVGCYYYAHAVKREGQNDVERAQTLFEYVADHGPLPYRCRAINSLGDMAWAQADLKSALLLFTEAGRFAIRNCIYDLRCTLTTQRMISVIKSNLGDHTSALAMLEKLFPLAKSILPIYPHHYFNYLNSLAVELSEVGLLPEAQAACEIVWKSPFTAKYREWIETREEIASKQLSRSRSIGVFPLGITGEIPETVIRKGKLSGCSREGKPRRNKSVESPASNLNLAVYADLLESIYQSKTNDQKKKSLELLARTLFESIGLICKYVNLRTTSSEIDIVVQIRDQKECGALNDFEPYILVECKNWKSPMGAAQVRDFIVKLQKTQLKLGIIFSKNGVSGKRYAGDAVREIRRVFDTDGLYILVISGKDLRAVEQGASFLEILDQKIDHLRFDLITVI
jgi:hypothetical protein